MANNLEYQKEYYKKNKQKVHKRQKEYYKNNKEDRIERTKIYNDNSWFAGNKERALERDNWQCQNCGINQEQHIIIFGRRISVHHKDGNGRNTQDKNNNLDNLQTLCIRCHASIHHKDDNKNRNKLGRFVKDNIKKELEKT